MQLLAPDILAEARGLPVTISGAGVALGLALWVTGWRLHRFWIVLGTTVLAGVTGLASGQAPGAQPLVSAVLLAVGAGALALDLSRVVAFAAGGLALWVVVHAALPTWDQPLLCFIAGGLVALLTFRACIMALTSLAGTLLLAYSGFCLADRLDKLDAVAWAGRHAGWLNWTCVALALVGWLIQLLLERRRARREEARQEQEKQILAQAREKEKEAKAKAKEKDKEKPKPWWGWEVIQGLRRAG
jgi:MFS family permease